MASELEFYLLRDSYEDAAKKDFHDLEPFGWYNEDYQLLQATKAEPLYRQFRNHMSAAGIPVEFSKGEAGPGQHEVNIHYAECARVGGPARPLQAWRQGDGVAERTTPSPSWRSRTTPGPGTARTCTCSLRDCRARRAPCSTEPRWRSPYGMSPTMRHFLGGLMEGIRGARVFHRAVRQLLQAVRARQLGADQPRLGTRQSHLRLPHRGRRSCPSHRERVFPAGTRIRISRMPPSSGQGCTASRSASSRPPNTGATATRHAACRGSRGRSGSRAAPGGECARAADLRR